MKKILLAILLSAYSPMALASLTLIESTQAEHVTAMITLDLNGDGVLELAACMPKYGQTGAVALFSGTSSGSIYTNAATYLLTGQNAGGDFGYSCAAADLNGDGFDDLVVGEPLANSDAGIVHVFLGGDHLGQQLEYIEYSGDEQSGLAGFVVSSAGDFNADGFDDLIVGAPNSYANGQPGAVYLVLGSGLLQSKSLSNFVRFHTGNVDNFGFSVSGGGDVNGDGYDDILIGAPNSSNGSSRSGTTHLILGSANPVSENIYSSLYAYHYNGESIRNYSGRAVAIVKDANGDGYDDILIGAPESSFAGSQSGAVYFVGGSANFQPATSSPHSSITLTTLNSAKWIGLSSGDQLGYSISSTGDFDGDGFNDIVIGAPGRDYPSTQVDRGGVYLVYGRSSLMTGLNTININSQKIVGPNNGVGFSVGGFLAPAGDYNSDGYGDYIIVTTGINSSFTSQANRSWLRTGGSRNMMTTTMTRVLP